MSCARSTHSSSTVILDLLEVKVANKEFKASGALLSFEAVCIWVSLSCAWDKILFRGIETYPGVNIEHTCTSTGLKQACVWHTISSKCAEIMHEENPICIHLPQSESNQH